MSSSTGRSTLRSKIHCRSEMMASMPGMLRLVCTDRSEYRFFVFPEGGQTRVLAMQDGSSVAIDSVVEVRLRPEEVDEVLIMARHLLKYLIGAEAKNVREDGLRALKNAVMRVSFGERLDRADLVRVPSSNE